ncbi:MULTISPECIES: YczE/YyaS/YitT family protein [Bacillus]|nr:hypothetical protein [Bacillus cereus]KAA1804897.1 hypothetical protein FXB61_004515 [Bacillus cereus]MBJ7966943.1 hypothetical protein [Bacillus cereus]MBJ8002215.1 hypothetical protein [Bacillus cereus]RWR54137.1 hypothetical protein DYR28_27350 [Bacillus cereus]
MKSIELGWTRQKILFYIAGCFVFSFGAKFFIDSKLGTDPLDVLVLGIVKHTGLTIGIVSGLIAIVFLLTWSIWNRKLPPITPFFTMFFVGSLIDIWNLIRVEKFTNLLFSPYLVMVIGLVLAAYGSALIIMSGIGIRTMDLLAITIVHKWKWHFFYAKMLFEVLFVLSGWLLGGPVGIGTLAFVITVGPGMILFISLNERYLGWKNFGLVREGAVA